MEDRTNEHLVIYNKNGQVIATGQPGVKEIELDNLTPVTDYAEGTYQIAWVKDNGDTSEKVSVPDFRTLAVLVESINLSQTALTGVEGTKLTNSFTITPADATDRTINVASEDKTVADVVTNDNTFTVSLIKAGQTNINFISKDGNASTKIQVTVTAPAPKPETTPASTPASSASQANSASPTASTTSTEPASAQPASDQPTSSAPAQA